MFFILLFFFSFFINGFSQSTSVGLPYCGLNIVLSLNNYNVSNPQGESVESFYDLPPLCVNDIVVTDIPENAYFIIVQVHSYLENVTLSYKRIPELPSKTSGTNVGLVKNVNIHYEKNGNVIFYLTTGNYSDTVSAMIAVLAYDDNAPIPGGCNMEFPVLVSPFFQTTYTSSLVQADFAPASPPFILFLPSTDRCNPEFPIKHTLYYRYNSEKDFTKKSYFNSIKSMLTVGHILKNGFVAVEKLTTSPMRRIFAAYPGTGITLVVVSSYLNHTSVYVPSFTYACNALNETNMCPVLDTTFSKVFCAMVLFIGLFICIFGHYFYRAEIFLFGFFNCGIVAYILFFVFVNEQIALTAGVGSGLLFAGFTLLTLDQLGIPLLSLVLATLTFGFFIASIILYPLLDIVDIFVWDINYWGIFIGIAISCPLLLLVLSEKANILACSFIGSYIVVMTIDYYLGSNIRYIIVNTIRRATVGKFRFALIAPPFQYTDVLLTTFWLLLMLMGIFAQKRLLKNKPPYPSQTSQSTTSRRRFFFNKFRMNRRRSEETSPLLPEPSAPSDHYSTIERNQPIFQR